ncbi:MAG: hypothetical protein DLM53_04630 [Candidatus Eremiobacter antarcticus]|nr:hypothetical protein [Candidatus Eremiobacteraeota bacterium]MBC5807931.1 hypothetical protein [Candidatus Eremiobacteraeota bacterium]PZR62701.1 MAG: hypothetical protein DLM53_04630 [Candidatus Eremiobacter sp. RRmetagenome_bin22]
MKSLSRASPRRIWKEHSLSIVAGLVLGAWIVLYCLNDPKTHLGAFYGNAIADWSGSVLVILGTKYLIERGSPESKKRAKKHGGVRGFLDEHSLSLFVFGTGALWALAYMHSDATSKWGQVVGNIVSEWGQMLGLVLLTKKLYERGSKESRSQA